MKDWSGSLHLFWPMCDATIMHVNLQSEVPDPRRPEGLSGFFFLAVQFVLTACAGIRNLVSLQAGGLAATINIFSHIQSIMFFGGSKNEDYCKIILDRLFSVNRIL
jgi:hypothetical protein